MQIVATHNPLSAGKVDETPEWKAAWDQVVEAIKCIDWPHGSGSFLLNPGQKKHENGVGPIKIPCLARLVQHGWRVEKLPRELAGIGMGNLDALKETRLGPIGFEWETGNISSSHRAVNKLVHAITEGALLGGILVVPCQRMRPFITDRIGNITELLPYFPVWGKVAFPKGILRIAVVDFDELSTDVPLIPKLADGNAGRAKAKEKAAAEELAKAAEKREAKPSD